MDFTNLRQNYKDLLSYLDEDGYDQGYIRCIKGNINWILENEGGKTWNSYTDIYIDRLSSSSFRSEGYKKKLMRAYGAIKQFDLYGKYPNRRNHYSLARRRAYYQLIPEFKELIDFYEQADRQRGIKKQTLRVNASAAASLLLAMQRKGLNNLSSISEKDVLSYFLDSEGHLSKSSSKKKLAAVFKAGIDWKPNECRRLLAYLPPFRSQRKNIKLLMPTEIEAVHSVLDDEASGLSLRDKAIVKLMFFTGLRACDIAGMKLSSIDWETEEIHISQQKTGVLLVLPLTATIGNSIYDYVVSERPGNRESHLFLSAVYPYYPVSVDALWHIAAKTYKAADLRQGKGDRRGTHLFRHHAATAFLSNGVPRPVISQTLGHASPHSLEPYLHADLVHLKACALSIEAFPVDEGVFCL